MAETAWIKASASGNTGECVEMRRQNDAIEVRDSKHPDGAVLRYTSAQFTAWLDAAKNGEFDLEELKP